MKKSILIMAVAFTATIFASCCGNNCGNNEKKAAEPAANKAIKFVITATVDIQPDSVERFRQVSESLIAGSRAEEGCISYSMYESATENNKFFFFEEWKDQAAVDAHFATPHFKDFGKLLDEIGAGPAVVKILEVSVEK
jgi:quinol monooxygenase YgiN